MKQQLLLIARDSKDPGAMGRRKTSRPDHLAKITELKKNGEFLYGGAILDDNGEMRGSVILYEVSGRERLDEILKEEPYILNKVWENIEILPFRLANFD